MNVKVFSADYFDSLVEEASQSPRARQHRNIHERYDDPCQRFLNAIGTDSYIRPYYWRRNGRSVREWRDAMNQFAIAYGDRFTRMDA